MSEKPGYKGLGLLVFLLTGCGPQQITTPTCPEGFHTSSGKNDPNCLSHTTLESCGPAGLNCVALGPPNSVPHCDGETCRLVCETSFHPEGEACLSDLTPTSCGPTGVDCSLDLPNNSTPACDGTTCGFVCQPDFDRENGSCINSKEAPCTDNPPQNATAISEPVTLSYTDDNGWTQPTDCHWSCDPDFDLENKACINSKKAPCTDDPPQNATSTPTEVILSYTDAAGWSQPRACNWTCDSTFHLEDETCLNDLIPTNCGPDGIDCTEGIPLNSTPTCDGTACGFVCQPDFHREDGACINSKKAPCTDNPPQNATSINEPVTLSYTDDNGWTQPTDCNWSCDGIFHPVGDACLSNFTLTSCGPAAVDCTHGIRPSSTPICDGTTCSFGCQPDFDLENDTCINSKEALCIDNPPQNATSINEPVTLSYTDDNGWTQTTDCNWGCDPDFDRENNTCINSKEAPCIDNPPQNATAINEPVTLSYTDDNQWTHPPDCDWTCNATFHPEDETCLSDLSPTSCGPTGLDCTEGIPLNSTPTCDGTACGFGCQPDFDLENNTCINSKKAPCTDNAPQNATSPPTEVTLSYTDDNGWTQPQACNWSCDPNFELEDSADFDVENDVCINSKEAPCTDAPPQNATSINKPVALSYTDGNGWSQPTECHWTCDPDFHLESETCLSDLTLTSCGLTGLDCTEEIPNDSTPTCDGTTCGFVCQPDFDRETGTCINSKEAPCTDNAPPNATSVNEPVTLSYTDAAGWSQPRACNWTCDPDFEPKNERCINSKEAPCTDNPPQNATSINEPVTVSYTSDNGWTQPQDCDWTCDKNFQDHDTTATCTPACIPGSETCGRYAHCEDATGTTICVCNGIVNPGVTVPGNVPDRGALVEATPLVSYDLPTLTARLQANSMLPEARDLFTSSPPVFGVQLFRLLYKSADSCNLEIQLSALIVLPLTSNPTALPLLSYQHGTLFLDTAAPSNNTELTHSPSISAAYYASHGFAVVAPDYVGFGETSEILHPNHDPKTLASSVVDAIFAFEEFISTQASTWNDTLFLAGYSEGGYATLVAQKSLEEDFSERFTVQASAPGAGAYDLHSTARLYIDMNADMIPYPAYIPSLLVPYNQLYNWDKSYSYFFNSPYSTRLDSLLGGTFTGAGINSQLSFDPLTLLNGDFVSDFEGGSPQARDILLNSVQSWDNWTPGSTTRFYHSPIDPVVPYTNATTAQSELSPEGQPLSLMDCPHPGPNPHSTCWAWYLGETLSFFKSL